MRICFHRYNSISEAGILDAFESLGFEVYQEAQEVTRKNIPIQERIEALSTALITLKKAGAPFDCVFSVNFFPYIADVCERLETPYYAITVDCPVIEIFSKSIANSCCHVFLFDRRQYELVHDFSPDTVFHLPLGSDPKLRIGMSGLRSAEPGLDPYLSYTPIMSEKENCISLVGSLYIEKSRLQVIGSLLSPRTSGFIEGLLDFQSELYGTNVLMDTLSNAQIREMKEAVEKVRKDFWPYVEDPICSMDDLNRYIATHYYLDHELTYWNRVTLLNALAKHFDVRLFTASPVEQCGLSDRVKVSDQVSTYRGMPNVFSHSAINLQPTLRSIETGISQRVFDVMLCEGFLMSNYQEELFEHFTPGQEFDLYESTEDLIEKCGYYLSHPEEREAIAKAGHEKVIRGHLWEDRIRTMFGMEERAVPE